MRTILLATFLVLPLSACSGTMQDREGDMTADAGLAVHHNIAAQIANPNAPTEHGAFITDGERAYRAIDRYKKGKVTPPTSASPNAKGNDSDGGTGDDKGTDSNQNTP